jgi:hypothetical protein
MELAIFSYHGLFAQNESILEPAALNYLRTPIVVHASLNLPAILPLRFHFCLHVY